MRGSKAAANPTNKNEETARPQIDPTRLYFSNEVIGYFEGIDTESGIALAMSR